jgi:hypothetical protein
MRKRWRYVLKELKPRCRENAQAAVMVRVGLPRYRAPSLPRRHAGDDARACGRNGPSAPCSWRVPAILKVKVPASLPFRLLTTPPIKRLHPLLPSTPCYFSVNSRPPNKGF